MARNEMHLGSAAHRLMAQEVFHQIEAKWLSQKQQEDQD